MMTPFMPALLVQLVPRERAYVCVCVRVLLWWSVIISAVCVYVYLWLTNDDVIHAFDLHALLVQLMPRDHLRALTLPQYLHKPIREELLRFE